jgi:hypothetical protein
VLVQVQQAVLVILLEMVALQIIGVCQVGLLLQVQETMEMLVLPRKVAIKIQTQAALVVVVEMEFQAAVALLLLVRVHQLKQEEMAVQV